MNKTDKDSCPSGAYMLAEGDRQQTIDKMNECVTQYVI